MKKTDNVPDEGLISASAFPGSKKIYVPGQLHDIKVAMREISLSPTKLANGKTEENASVIVYDTSGAYSDERTVIDIKKGLPRLRQQWIVNRKDVEALDDMSSAYGKLRQEDVSLDHLRIEHK